MQNSHESLFSNVPPVANEPGYLTYWEIRADADPEDGRVARIVEGLTHTAIRGEAGRTRNGEFTDRSSALQARYWYRSLGPLNPLVDAVPDLIRAANMMHGQSTESTDETDSLKIDTAYLFADIARHTDDMPTAKEAIRLGIQSVDDIQNSLSYDSKPGLYKLQTKILEGDLRQDAVRLRYTGKLRPDSLGTDQYREYERAFVREEARAISDFGEMVANGITEENFGALFEWFFILARRHQAWADEAIDVVSVRGATSRENAEWTGEHTINPNRTTGNHDIVINTHTTDGYLTADRLQLKTVSANIRHYHPRVQVIDFHEVFNQRFRSIDQATLLLVQQLKKFRLDYINRH